VRSDGPALVFLQRVVVEGIVVPLVVVGVVVVFGVRVEVDVGEGAGAFTEQAVVEALLQFPRFAEPASSSFSRHVVTCLARAAKSSLHRWPEPRLCPFILPQPEPRRVQFAGVQHLTGTADSRNGRDVPLRPLASGSSGRISPSATPSGPPPRVSRRTGGRGCGGRGGAPRGATAGGWGPGPRAGGGGGG